MAWYEEWFGEEYLELYSHRDAAEAGCHVDFVERVLGPERPHAVLDLACGAGRHTEALRARGLRALGVDLSLTLLAAGSGLPRVAGDMRRLPFVDETFTWVLNFFTSFGYFESERENFQVLEEVVRLLRPGGRFVIDLFNRQRTLDSLVPRESFVTNDRRVEIERWFDPSDERIYKRIRLSGAGREPRTYGESVRAYRREEVETGLRWAGLEVDDVYGDFDGRPHGPSTERLILVGHKPERAR